ncbi:hypothetical protein V6N11_036597 [Hibiscus sabdariffa]|uniref:Uncharacterized protein n=1 Tax=Hibiscus sabdariffa TaxID=183260 RepID=A0ABR2RAU5_9ROSI
MVALQVIRSRSMVVRTWFAPKPLSEGYKGIIESGEGENSKIAKHILRYLGDVPSIGDFVSSDSSKDCVSGLKVNAKGVEEDLCVAPNVSFSRNEG